VSRSGSSPVSGPVSGGRASAQTAPEGGTADHRRELRRAAAGPITVRFGYQRVHEVQGRLLDVSVSGFRMAYQGTTLETGQTVTFFHPEASGNARVVWNRVVDQMVETGFFIVDQPDTRGL